MVPWQLNAATLMWRVFHLSQGEDGFKTEGPRAKRHRLGLSVSTYDVSDSDTEHEEPTGIWFAAWPAFDEE